MFNFQELIYNKKLSSNRIYAAENILGAKVINHIIAFALYLMGVNRAMISKLLNYPPGTIRSIIRAILKFGVPAFQDKRKKTSTFLPTNKPMIPTINLQSDNEFVSISFDTLGEIKMSQNNPLQIKTILLTLLKNNFIKLNEVKNVLHLSNVHIKNLSNELDKNDILIFNDKRKGQQKDYKFTPAVKSALIQQYIFNIITKVKNSSKLLSEQIKQQFNICVSDRSIRHHISKLGLSELKKSLPLKLDAVKKN